jgi:preprotein translocase subunit YajC
MEKVEIVVFERMAKAQERIVALIEQQRHGRAAQALATGATVVAITGILGAIDIIVK